MPSQRLILHLVGNAHLDPVWLWDWREGLNEGIGTCRAILDLMDEDADVTFIRGESAVYEHIESHDPATFRRILAAVESGRWDPVGGTVVQSDSNLTSTETLLHSFIHGQRYFRSRFGRSARVAWLADSFGHSAGLPEVFAAAGIESFAFTRPGSSIVPIDMPAFWWEGAGGLRVLAYRPPVGWYGCERDAMPRALDALAAAALAFPLRNVGVFYGLGNHGGGPSRRHVADIRAWAAAHPEHEVRFSTLHGLMDALRDEAAQHGSGFLPVHRGELNFCLRGCYSSLARVKYFFRRAEALTSRAERGSTAIGALLGPGAPQSSPRNARAGLLFNSFHDILPGSLIERAVEDQLAWMGGAYHRAQRAENDSLLALAATIDTQTTAPGPDLPAPVPVLLWNPHPFDVDGPVEIEAALDARPIWKYKERSPDLPVELRGPDGGPLVHQVVPNEHLAMPELPWRKRVVTRVRVPATGWSVVTIAWKEGARVPAARNPVTAPRIGCIDNGIYRVTARPGSRGIQVFLRGKPALATAGLHLVTVDDPWGSWGGMAEEKESLDLSTITARWRITAVHTLESGPERGMLWVRMEGGSSRSDLRIALSRGRPAVDASARILWNERSARLKLVMPCAARDAMFEVPGGIVRRGPCGEVPGGRWVRVSSAGPVSRLGFASDALYGFDIKNGALRATVVRATRYSDDRVVGADAEPWTPAADAGELRFRFFLSPGGAELPAEARVLEEPVVAMTVPRGKGARPRTGSLLRLDPPSLRIVALKPAEKGDGVVIVLQSTDGKPALARVQWIGSELALGRIEAGKIAAWRLSREGERWTAAPASALD